MLVETLEKNNVKRGKVYNNNDKFLFLCVASLKLAHEGNYYFVCKFFFRKCQTFAKYKNLAVCLQVYNNVSSLQNIFFTFAVIDFTISSSTYFFFQFKLTFCATVEFKLYFLICFSFGLPFVNEIFFLILIFYFCANRNRIFFSFCCRNLSSVHDGIIFKQKSFFIS